MYGKLHLAIKANSKNLIPQITKFTKNISKNSVSY